MTLPEFNHITEQMKKVTRKQKAKLLIVDDEPDNLDLLYRTFRRDFNVFRANNGVEALEVLEKEGEVAVIISDQRMPEMKGTEFFSRTVPQFPNTMRIILTGFTDVEDLVQAINAGQVYRYITKPWEPEELKEVVRVAVETYSVTNNRLAELERNKIQTNLLAGLLELFASDKSLKDLLNETAALVAPAFKADACCLETVQGGDSEKVSGVAGDLSEAIALPDGDPLIAKAQETQESQLWVLARATPVPEGIAYYGATGIKQHLLLPLLYRQEIVAFLSLQWLDVCPLQESDFKLLHLAGQQIVFSLLSQSSVR